MQRNESHRLSDDPLWYKDGVIYQLHVKAFFDRNGDGIGDFPGLTEKLDYLQDLGVTALWLLPFYPSPLRDDGYDIASYEGIHPNYGNLDDFKSFLDEAHRRGLRVITELVINHTSDQHPWFQRARRAPQGSAERDFYVWSDDPQKYKEARIIFKDFEVSNWAWDPVAESYYWHRFFNHQPDLNFESDEVQQAVLDALDLWMNLGVDGLRLDAIPYLYEREGTSCENLPETHVFLKKLRAHVDANFQNRMLLAEANQWPEDSLPYFGEKGDECHVAFHFPLMPRLFMSVAMEDRYPIIEIMQQTPDIPPDSQWALFLRNHDELTLEMVTEEDRDYMYRTYARERQARINLGIRRRLAPLLENHRRRIELMNALLFSFPGTPIVYYGDEIGMGDNIYLGDRHGVRTPMQWSPDRNAGFSRANPQRLYLPVIIDPEYHYEAVNVEAQQNNPHSLLWWMKRMIDLRKQLKAMGRGTLEFLHPDNGKILALLRSYEDETILVVANLSRLVQYAELDLSKYKGLRLVELSGHTEFPRISDRPYLLTLGPHQFYWLRFESVEDERGVPVPSQFDLPTLEVSKSETLADVVRRRDTRQHLITYLKARRWFGGKGRRVQTLQITDLIPLGDSDVSIALIRIDYVEGSDETYLIPLSIEWRANADLSHAVAYVTTEGKRGVLHEPLSQQGFARSLLDKFINGEGTSDEGHLIASGKSLLADDVRGLEAHLIKGEQSNTSLLFGERYFMKIFRRLEEGENIDVEVTRFFAEQTEFRHVAHLAGALQYRKTGRDPITVAMLQQSVPNSGDAWRYTLDALGRYFEQLSSNPLRQEQKAEAFPGGSLLDLAGQELLMLPRAILGSYIGDAEMLGRRTGEMHVALASRPDIPEFAPEPFTPHYQRSIYQGMRSQVSRALLLLRKNLMTLPESLRPDAERVLELELTVHEMIRPLVDRNIRAMRTRIHGDYHLGQVLKAGNDYVIIDFEGEPSRPLSERRIKRSPLKDVAGMLRSFSYAPNAVLLGKAPGVHVRSEDVGGLEPASRFWQQWISAIFLRSYLEATAVGSFLPEDRDELSLLLNAYLLDKAFYELAYEINNRPEWAGIPLKGILTLVSQ